MKFSSSKFKLKYAAKYSQRNCGEDSTWSIRIEWDKSHKTKSNKNMTPLSRHLAEWNSCKEWGNL